MKHDARRNMADPYAKGYSNPNNYSVAHSNIAVYDVLMEIRDLLKKRLPEKPMEVIVRAPRPVEDTTAGHPAHVGGMKLKCASNPHDRLTVSEISGNEYEFLSEMGDGEETVIHLSAEDAKLLAQAILGLD